MYLYSLLDEDTLWLFPCFIKGIQGATLPDTGATKNYVSRLFAQKAGVPIERFETDKHVSLAGGQKMVVYGKCRLPVQISGWQGYVDAVVLDLDAEFDLVLGRNWHRQYKAITHWESMIMEITSEGKQYWLVPYPRRLGSIEGEPDFGCNIISLRGALKAMEKRGTEAVLYFVRNVEKESESVPTTSSAPKALDPRITEPVTPSSRPCPRNRYRRQCTC